MGCPPVNAELTELKVESNLGCLLESAALLGCTWAGNSRLGEALVYQKEDRPSVIGVAAMDSFPAGEDGKGFVQAGFSVSWPQEVAGRNNHHAGCAGTQAAWEMDTCSFAKYPSNFIPESGIRMCIKHSAYRALSTVSRLLFYNVHAVVGLAAARQVEIQYQGPGVIT